MKLKPSQADLIATAKSYVAAEVATVTGAIPSPLLYSTILTHTVGRPKLACVVFTIGKLSPETHGQLRLHLSDKFGLVVLRAPLFAPEQTQSVVKLTPCELRTIYQAARIDWKLAQKEERRMRRLAIKAYQKMIDTNPE